MTSRLESLAPEIIQLISTSLSFDEICNLRSVSRALSAKATDSSFRQYFLKKRLCFSPEALQQAVYMSSRSTLCCAVQELTLEASFVYPAQANQDSDPWTLNASSEMELPRLDVQIHEQAASALCEFLRNIKSMDNAGSLRQVTLVQDFTRARATRRFLEVELESEYRSALGLFRHTLQSLVLADLPCESIDVFCSNHGSALPYHLVLTELSRWTASSILRNVKKLRLRASISLLEKALGESTESTFVLTTVRILNSLPRLESLHVHLRRVCFGWGQPTLSIIIHSVCEDWHKIILTPTPATVYSSMKSLTIRGARPELDAFAALLRLVPGLRELHLDYVHFHQTSDHEPLRTLLQGIFDFISQDLKELCVLYVGDISASSGLGSTVNSSTFMTLSHNNVQHTANVDGVQFCDSDAGPSPYLPVNLRDRCFSKASLTRRGDNIRDGISWTANPFLDLDLPETRAWQKEIRRTYG